MTDTVPWKQKPPPHCAPFHFWLQPLAGHKLNKLWRIQLHN